MEKPYYEDYNWFMKITYEEYSRSRAWLTTKVEQNTLKGIFTLTQEANIWRHFEDVVKQKADAAVAAGANQTVYVAPPEASTSSGGGFLSWMSNASSDFKDRIDGGAKSAGDAVKSAAGSVLNGVSGLLNYVIIGIVVLVVVKLIKR
jgi:hypothetical protein